MAEGRRAYKIALPTAPGARRRALARSNAGSAPAQARAWISKMDSAYARSTSSMAERAYADRKSTRLNSSHVRISYAVFCLKKKTCTRITKQQHDLQRTALPHT